MPSHRAILLFLTASCLSATASAQDFRVYTTVRPTGESQVLSRSQTLFHAGRTYDYIEAVGEVVIGEPAQHRFTIIREGHIGTRVSFDELNQFRKVGREETRGYARQLVESGEDGAAAAALVFQLAPEFTVEDRSHALGLSADVWSYDVTTADPPSPDFTRAYLDYADRAAVLNYVLHPQSFYPSPRESLNGELRRRGEVPTKVSLNVSMGRPVELTAEHHYEWTLHTYDRTQIQKWQRLAESNAVEWVSFREFQTRVVSGK